MAQPEVIVFSTANVDDVPMLSDNNVFTGTNTFNVVNGTVGTIDTFSSGTASIAYGTTGQLDAGGTSKFGDGTNCVQIDGVGDMTFVGSATVWDDLQVNLNAVKLPASGAATQTAYKGGYILSFDKAAVNTIYFNAQLPHSYKEGSGIEFHLHVAHPDGSAGDSVWLFTQSWASHNQAFPTQGTTIGTIAAPGTADIHEVKVLAGTIPGTAQGISSVLLCSLARVGTADGDTYDNDVYLTALDFHFEKDMVGSRERLTK